MSDNTAAAVAIAVGALIAVAVLLTRVYNAHVRALHPGPETPWVLVEHVSGGRLQVQAVRGNEQISIGPALDCNADDFNDRIELTRADAAMRLAALNSGKRRLPLGSL